MLSKKPQCRHPGSSPGSVTPKGQFILKWVKLRKRWECLPAQILDEAHHVFKRHTDKMPPLFKPHFMFEPEVKNEDCMLAMSRYPDKFFDLAIVDPEYGIGENKGQHKSRNANRIDRRTGKPIIVKHKGYPVKEWDNERPSIEYFEDLFRVSKNQIVFGGNYFADMFPASSCWIVWDKVNGESDFADCELAWTSFKTAVRQFRFMWSGFCQGKSATEGYINQGDKSLCEKRIHPTQKPVVLYKWLLKNYAKPGDKILDTHGGSMSSVIACLEMGFDIWCYELDPDYYKAAIKRIDQYKSQLRLFKPDNIYGALENS